MADTATSLVAEAKERYARDVEFHARVFRAAQLVEAELKIRTGGCVQQHERTLLRTAAAVALVLAERDVVSLEKASG